MVLIIWEDNRSRMQMFFAPATTKLSLEIQDLYAQHVKAWIYLTCKWHYLRTLHLYINFSCKAEKVSKTLAHLLHKCQLFKAELLKYSYLPNLCISGEFHMCVSEPSLALFLLCWHLGFLMQHISKCSSEHTCPLVFWENRMLSKNLLCKTYKRGSTCSFLFN